MKEKSWSTEELIKDVAKISFQQTVIIFTEMKKTNLLKDKSKSWSNKMTRQDPLQKD